VPETKVFGAGISLASGVGRNSNGGILKRKIISGEQIIQGEDPSFFRAHLDSLHKLMLEIRAGLIPPCFAILGGGDHVLTLKHLAQNMVAGEKTVFCFDISASKGNPWNRLLPTVTDLEIPLGGPGLYSFRHFRSGRRWTG